MWGFVFSALSKAVGAGLNFVEKRHEGNALFKQGAMQRDLYGKNADLAEQQSKDAIARGQEASNRQSYKMRTMLGAQSAGFAGQGVNVTGGAAAAVIGNDQALGEADRLNIVENARRTAWGYQQQADIYRGQGELAYQAGVYGRKQANAESIGSLANFGGDMFDLYKGYNS